MTLNDLKSMLCIAFPQIENESLIDIHCQYETYTIYLVIRANVLSQDVQEYLHYYAPVGLYFIIVTEGWTYGF